MCIGACGAEHDSSLYNVCVRIHENVGLVVWLEPTQLHTPTLTLKVAAKFNHTKPETERVGHVPETVSGTVSRGVRNAVEAVEEEGRALSQQESRDRYRPCCFGCAEACSCAALVRLLDASVEVLFLRASARPRLRGELRNAQGSCRTRQVFPPLPLLRRCCTATLWMTQVDVFPRRVVGSWLLKWEITCVAFCC